MNGYIQIKIQSGSGKTYSPLRLGQGIMPWSGAGARGRYGRVFKYQPELSQIQIDAGNISLQIGK